MHVTVILSGSGDVAGVGVQAADATEGKKQFEKIQEYGGDSHLALEDLSRGVVDVSTFRHRVLSKRRSRMAALA